MNKRFLRVTVGDAMFAFQIVMTVVFCLPQAIKMFSSVQGVTITWLLFAFCFIVLNLFLAARAHAEVRSRATLQTLLIYANWCVLFGPVVLIAFAKCPWVERDTIISIGITTASIMLVTYGYSRNPKLGITDPMIRGGLAGLCRAVPHLYMVYVMFLAQGVGGIHFISLMSANVTAITRIVLLWLSKNESGWNRNIHGSFWSEIANEGTWLLVTAVWFVYHQGPLW